MTVADLTAKLTLVARRALENGAAEVQAWDGVLWLRVGGRTVASLGLVRAGLRRAAKEIEEYAAAR